MPTGTQDNNFAKEMSQQVDEVKMSHSALDAAIDWIASNLNPDDVFSTKDLEGWAESNGYVKE
jgi:hypothetical protein